MAHDDHAPSAIQRAQSALLAFSQSPDDSVLFEACAAMVAPSLFKGRGAFFDNLCSHARGSSVPALHAAIGAFMDRLCRSGGFDSQPGQPERVWRSSALLCELHPEDGLDDPRFLQGLDLLRGSIAKLFNIRAENVAISPIALDLRQAEMGFELFQWAMLPSQLEAIGAEALARNNPNGTLPAGFSEPARLWRALMISCAFDADKAPADIEERLRDALGEGAEYSCHYAVGDQERSAVLVAKDARGPFTCCLFGFEPERWELEADLARVGAAFGDDLSRWAAFIEPIAADQAVAPGQLVSDLPLESFALSLCAPDGALIDALWLPARPESLVLAERMLAHAGVPLRMSPPAKIQNDSQGRRLWRSSLGRAPFDIDVWRSRVLAAV
jgi:hypothetical protein